VAASLNPSGERVYKLPGAEESTHIGDIVEQSGLNSSEVLATLFDLEIKGAAIAGEAKSVRCCYDSTYGANHVPLIPHLRAESIPKADSSI
jgi:hypothetical protein